MNTANAPARLPASFRKIRFELAREEGHPEGEPDIGYELIAPLTREGRIDAAQWRAHRHLCRVVRFRPDEGAEIGHLVHRRGVWTFQYDLVGDVPEEAGQHFETHVFAPGEYVSIADGGGVHTYRVASVTPAAA